MSRLNNRLNLWEQNRLIAPEQKQLILDFESQNKTPHLPYAVFMLGVFVTALGIISLIAANWEEIGGGVKLTADFILLAVLAGGIMRAQNRGSAFWREAGIFALFMMTGASIGLITQVFQTNGTLANGALTWALFSAPLLAVSGKKRCLCFGCRYFLRTLLPAGVLEICRKRDFVYTRSHFCRTGGCRRPLYHLLRAGRLCLLPVESAF